MTAPASSSVEGPSFPIGLRVLASALVAGLVLQALSTLQLRGAAIGWEGGLGLAALLAMVLLGYGSIMRSRTHVGDEFIRQRWLFTREVRVDEIVQVKLIDVPGLRWIVVPRFVVRTRGMRVFAFYVGDPRVLQAVRELIARGAVRS